MENTSLVSIEIINQSMFLFVKNYSSYLIDTQSLMRARVCVCDVKLIRMNKLKIRDTRFSASIAFFFSAAYFLSLAFYRSVSQCFSVAVAFSRRFFVQPGDLCELAAPETNEPFIPCSSVDARAPSCVTLTHDDMRDILNFKPHIIIIHAVCPPSQA